MGILSKFFKKSEAKRIKSDLSIKTLRYVFGDECALCNNKIEYLNFIEIEDKKVPACLFCKALVENGCKWTAILKKNYENEKRRYCNKYLRIVAWFSDFD